MDHDIEQSLLWTMCKNYFCTLYVTEFVCGLYRKWE